MSRRAAALKIVKTNYTPSAPWMVVIVCMIALANDFWLRIGVLSQTRRHHFETLLAGKKQTTPATARAA
jgi:hypothetical protein